MKLIDASAEEFKQTDYTLKGALQAVEKIARVSYLSDDKITDTSYIKFTNNLRKKKHMAAFEFGTIYLQSDKKDDEWSYKYVDNKYSKSILKNDQSYVTTTLRVIYDNHWEDDLKYIVSPTPYHVLRCTYHIVCSGIIQREIVRHRVFSFLFESTRYIGYNKKKFGAEIKIIRPEWMKYKHPKRAERIYLRSMRRSERDYFKLIKLGLKPQDARGVLPYDQKSEGYMSAYVDFKGWWHFFELRLWGVTGTPHPDIKFIAQQIFNSITTKHKIKTQNKKYK